MSFCDFTKDSVQAGEPFFFPRLAKGIESYGFDIGGEIEVYRLVESYRHPLFTAAAPCRLGQSGEDYIVGPCYVSQVRRGYGQPEIVAFVGLRPDPPRSALVRRQ